MSDKQQSEAPTPAFPGWKTSYVFTILGIVANVVLSEILNQIGSTTVIYVFSFVWIVVVALYTLIVYQRCFTDKPLLTNSYALSFLNGFVGYFFGLFWNHNLTRGDRGISHYFYVILWILLGVLTLTVVLA